MTPTLLIVDDEKTQREGLRAALEERYDVYLAEDAKVAMELLEKEQFDVLLTDFRLPHEDGMKLITRAKSLSKPPICILMTAYGSEELAVEAMKHGADDYIAKGRLQIDELEMRIARALRQQNLETENVSLRQQLEAKFGLANLVGESSAMREVFEVVQQVAPTRATVLLLGESGTGKEMLAKAIHQLSPRVKQPMVTVHCAALSPTFLESELFGHEKGAFTGAYERRIGRFEQAQGGTLFLDEIGEIDATLQIKLLRFLGERTFERVGSNKTLTADVRLIAATNQNLEERVKAGAFREDLFFRFRVVEITLPPLRARVEDLPLLAQAFLREFATENQKAVKGLTADALDGLLRYQWPGNVRELRTAMEHAVVLCRGEKITMRDLPAAVRNATATSPSAGLGPQAKPGGRDFTMDEAQKEAIIRALKETNGNRVAAAKKLGIGRRTLQRKIKLYHLKDFEMDLLQEVIHKLEVGGGTRYLRKGLLALTLLLLVVGYNWRGFRNMSTQEAMDAAQVGRNLAQGRGFSTLFIRPFSTFLVQQHNQASGKALDPANVADPAQIKGHHPDLANAPVYPVVLAGLMKVLPFEYAATASKPFWSYEGRFWRYQPDFLISLFNQLVFFGVITLVYLLARRLFEPSVALLSALLMLGTEQLWRFSVSGLSTMLLLLIFLGLVWCLVLLEAEAREPKGGLGRALVLAGVAGLLLGLGALTRYAFGWLVLPVVGFVVLFAGGRRLMLAGLTFALFAAAMAPWIARNYAVSGTPFGTAGFAIYETTTPSFPEFRLERSFQPDLNQRMKIPVQQKLVTNLRQIIQNELPRFGGSWLGAFFLVGLLVAFRDPAVTRLRYFLVASLLLLCLVQALGRTQLSEDSPDINSENLLVLLAPLALVYGASLFYLLLDQIEFPVRELRYAAVGCFGVVVCLPMILSFFPPRTTPVAYPPYYPPAVQIAAGWSKANELTVSDMPWAMAWYGQRQCAWLSGPSDFLTVNDFQKPIQLLYLTRLTLDDRFLTQWVQPAERNWGPFVLQTLPRLSDAATAWSKVDHPPLQMTIAVRTPSSTSPVPFPLHYWQSGWPEQFLLTAREHWPRTP